MGEGDGVTTKDFTAHMAEIAEKEARILKTDTFAKRLATQLQGRWQREQEARQRKGG